MPGGPYDLITINYSLHHAGKPVELMKSARGALKPGGAFLVTEYRKSDNLQDDTDTDRRIVYAVGLQAGPRFFRTFRRQGVQFAVIGIATVAVGAVATVLLAVLLHLPYDLATGLYTGALTNTPALAAAIDAVARVAPGHDSSISVGYGIAYPFSMIGLVLLVQCLPRLLRRDVKAEEAAWLKTQSADTPDLMVKQYHVSNPICDGKCLAEINPHRISAANVSRIRREGKVRPARPDTVLQIGDVVMVVGTQAELAKMGMLFGEETCTPMDVGASVSVADAEVTGKSLVGHRLDELRVGERYNVVITRIRRQGVEIAPVGSSVLEMGDGLRVVGDPDSVSEFVQLAGSEQHRLEETNMLTFLIGLLLGIIIGTIPFRFSDGIVVRLGTAGGAFIMSLLVGHFGRIGSFRLYVPPAARNLSRELGLMLFLAGAGANAGSKLIEVIQQQGPMLFGVGAIITIAAVATALILMLRVYKMNTLATLGALCACMTNPPGQGAATAQAETDLPALAFASVYPVAMIVKIVLAQVLVELLRAVVG